MKSIILISIFTFFSFSAILYGQNPCGQGTIIINGDDVDAVIIDGSNRQGLSLPIWLEANSTLAAGNRVKLISVIEFDVVIQSGGGNTLVFNRVISVGSAQQTVGNDKKKI